MSQQQNVDTKMSQPVAAVSINHLPDDILLRIIYLSGGPGTQVGTAYTLGAVSIRFHRLLKDQFLTSITHLSQECISSLSLSDAPAARASLTSMFSSTPAVKELNFNGCSPTLLSRGCIDALARSACNALISVNLAYCRLTDDVVRPLLSCTMLRTLILQRCDGLTGTMFGDGPCHAPLEVLDLSWVQTLTLDGVASIANVVTLKNVILKGCDAVMPESLTAFTKSNIRHSLKSICLAYCPISERALFKFLERSSNLTELVLAEYTGNIWMAGDFTDGFIAELRSIHPHVKIKFET